MSDIKRFFLPNNINELPVKEALVLFDNQAETISRKIDNYRNLEAIISQHQTNDKVLKLYESACDELSNDIFELRADFNYRLVACFGENNLNKILNYHATNMDPDRYINRYSEISAVAHAQLADITEKQNARLDLKAQLQSLKQEAPSSPSPTTTVSDNSEQNQEESDSEDTHTNTYR